MAKNMFVGVSNVARNVKMPNIGVSNVKRSALRGYVGISNVARQFFEAAKAAYSSIFAMYGASSSGRTVHEYFRGVDSATGMWRFYLDTTGTTTNRSNPVSCVATIEGDFSNQTVAVTFKGMTTSSEVSNGDGVKLIYRQSGSWVDWSSYILDALISDDFETRETTLPSSVDAIRIGVWHATAGTWQSELYVKSLTVDGLELV